MTWLLKRFHRPCWEQLHVTTVFCITAQREAYIYTWMQGQQTELIKQANLTAQTWKMPLTKGFSAYKNIEAPKPQKVVDEKEDSKQNSLKTENGD